MILSLEGAEYADRVRKILQDLTFYSAPHDAKINSCFFVFVLFLSPLNAKIAWINETWTAFFNCNTKTFEFGLLAILSW